MLQRNRWLTSVQGPTSRRHFLKLAAGSSAGLTLLLNTRAQAESPAPSASAEGAFKPSAYVEVAPDSTVSVVIKHLEMGQGAFIGLSTLVAEELDASWEQMRPVNAPADPAYNNTFWNSQGVGGSTGLSNSFMQFRLAGATARAMLVGAAAEQWQVPVAEIDVKAGVISHAASNRKASFGELASAASKLKIPAADSLTLKTPDNFTLIGNPELARNDTGKTDGSAIFTQDIRLPGMQVAMVAHPPRFGARVSSVDDSKATAIEGVIKVVQIPTGVAVIAQHTWAAKQGRDALIIEWDESNAFRGSSEAIIAAYHKTAAQPGTVATRIGDAPAELASGEVIEASFEFPYLAHAAMEPMNCVARVSEAGVEIWNGCQVPAIDQGMVSAALKLKPEQVQIHTQYAGGSFGRRANPFSDYVLEAVSIARQADGKPVKLVWTREDDTRAGYFRPAYVHRIQARLDEQGMPLAWQHRIVGQSILKNTAFESMLVKDGVDSTSVEGAKNLPYQIPNLQVELSTVDQPVPVQWWRAVGHTHTAYSTEVMIDQLAKTAGKDPVEYRMALLSKHPRHQGVLKLAAEKAGWGKPLPDGHFHGVAVHESFFSYVAEVAEIKLHEDKTFSVVRVTCAVDCGLAVNPDVVKAQMEGGIGFGLSPALMSEITLQDGAVVQSNFHDYQVARINHIPQIDVHIVPSAEPPTGVGEPGTPPVIPAIANALAAATGSWQTRLPLQGAKL